MSQAALDQFELDLDTQAQGREGVVVDVRWNRGGWVAPFVLEYGHDRPVVYRLCQCNVRHLPS